MYNLTNLRYCFILIFLLTSVMYQSSYAQDKHTVLLYTFETGQGDIVKDLSENGNDGTLMGPKRGDGKVGQGLVLGGNGPKDFVEIPDSDSLDLVDGLTVEMWVYLNSAPTAGGVGATKEATYKVGPRSDQKMLLRMTTSSKAWISAVVIGNMVLPLNKWIHTAGTYDAKSGEGKIYIDGEIDNESDIGGGDIVPNDDVLWLGRGASPYLDGSMDEVRISNIARSQKEIQQLMKIGIEGVLAVTPKDKLATTWGQLKLRFVK